MTRGSIRLSRDEPFRLDLTLGCGQAFRWTRDGKWWTGVVRGHLLQVSQEKTMLKFHGATEDLVRHYFSLDLDLPPVLATIDRDPVIHSAITACEGLRIVRQEPFECLVSYICATCSNIPAITRRVGLLARHHGKPLSMPGDDDGTGRQAGHGFPDAKTLSRAGTEGLSPCILGYRAPYVAGTAATLHDSPGWEEEVARMGYWEARSFLTSLPGVGPKVADCVLLFAFGRYEAFPVDVWIQRIISRHYLNGNLQSPNQVRRFGMDYFGKYAGYAQEYLYCCRDRLCTDA